MDKSGEGDSRDGGPSSNPTTASSSSVTSAIGCGSNSGSSLPMASPMTLNVTTTTGGSFSVTVDGENSVENLKKIISKKLKVSKDRICLLHRERELHDGTLRENGLMDGSKLILTPNVETGLLAQRAENTVMQALESLNDNQVNDFLSGKSPLNLSVRLGDHMMLIQLQLSTLNPSSQNGSRGKAHRSRSAITGLSGGSSTSAVASSSIQSSSSRGHSRTTIPIGFRRVPTPSGQPVVEQVSEAQTLTKQEIDNIHNIVKKLAASENSTLATVSPSPQDPIETDSGLRSPATESPIKSLSNLVSSSINSNIPAPSTCNNNILASGPSSSCADPISANLTSCLCKSLDSNDNNCCDTNCLSRTPEPQQPSTSTARLHRTAHNPIARHKAKVQTIKKHLSFDSATLARSELDIVQPIGSASAHTSPQRADQSPTHNHQQQNHYHHHHHQNQQQSQVQVHPQPGPSTDPNNVENPALAEASRNLTQTLRKLSKRVFTNKTNDASQEAARNVNSGAVIESMKHHGKGIYSGTFSGTLNPALQDKFGRPKRDISTIIHILNDLLSAAPQCARSGTKIYFEPSQTSATSTVAAASTVPSAPMTPSIAGSSSAVGTSNGSNLNAAVPTPNNTITTPMATPSPRLVSRCVPTPIQTKKYPSSGNSSTSGTAGPSFIICKSTEQGVPSAYNRCHHSHHQHQKLAPAKILCKCGLTLTPTSDSPVDGSIGGSQCPRCAAISAAELENSKTKSKLDNLRLIMQQKKERREARKQKCAPYSIAASTLAAANASVTPSVLSNKSVAVVGASGSVLEAARSSRCQLVNSTTTTNNAAAGVEAMEQDSPLVQSTTAIASSSSSSNNNAAATATATATTTTSATAAAAASSSSSSEAAQNHQIVEEVDTVA